MNESFFVKVTFWLVTSVSVLTLTYLTILLMPAFVYSTDNVEELKSLFTRGFNYFTIYLLSIIVLVACLYYAVRVNKNTAQVAIYVVVNSIFMSGVSIGAAPGLYWPLALFSIGTCSALSITIILGAKQRLTHPR